MKKSMRLAVVGCGGISRTIALFGRMNRKISLSSACDVSEERAGAFARRYGISRIFTDYNALLEQDSPDAVYLAVPHHLHYGMIEKALQAGVPVFAEKPVTRTLEEGMKIHRSSEETGVAVGVNYQHRYSRGGYKLARTVQSGILGRIHAVRINVPWCRRSGYFIKSPWHCRAEYAGGGTLITQGSHFLDLALWALKGDVPRSATGYTAMRRFGANPDTPEGRLDLDVEDLAQGIIEMESGALVQINSTMAASSEQKTTIEFYGEKGTAFYSSFLFSSVRFRNVSAGAFGFPVKGLDAHQKSLEGFRSWIMDGTSYLTPAGEALPALAAVEAIYKSALSGRNEDIAVLTDRADQPGRNST